MFHSAPHRFPLPLSSHHLYIRLWHPPAWVAAVAILAIHLLLAVVLSHSTYTHIPPPPARSFSKHRLEHALPSLKNLQWLPSAISKCLSWHSVLSRWPQPMFHSCSSAHTLASCQPNIRLFPRYILCSSCSYKSSLFHLSNSRVFYL